MSGCQGDSGEPFLLVSYCCASLVDWCTTLPKGALVPSSGFECHHTVPKRRPPMTQGCVQYPRRVVTSNTLLPYGISRVQQLTVSQCNALKNRDGNTWLKYTEGQRKHFKQGCINPDRQVTRTTKFIKVTTNICGSSVWRYIQFTVLAPKTLKRFVDLQNVCAPLLIKWAE